VAVAGQVAFCLRERRLAVAESCTAGRIATVFATVEQAIDFFAGGLVPYQTKIKRALLGVTAPSVLSLEAAEQMAAGVCRLLRAEVGVSTTGVAGDAPEDGVPPGTVFIGTSVDGATTSRVHHFHGSPDEVCDAARDAALHDLLVALDTVQHLRECG
jgi:nicotinamide-nucleotide amidase